MRAAVQPRGVRNNNPGNLRDHKIPWKGLIGADADGYCRFDSPHNGMRALVKDVAGDWHRKNARSVLALISQFAPPQDRNPTGKYIGFVAEQLGVLSGEPIDITRGDVLFKLIKAIIRFECGYHPYDDAAIMRAIVDAGERPLPDAPLAESRTMKGARDAAIGTVLTTATAAGGDVVVRQVEAVRDQLGPFQDLVPWLRYVVLAATVALLLFGLWRIVRARLDDRARGLR